MNTKVLQIRYVSNDGTTEVISVGEEITVGRAFFCDVHVQDLLASREHARFFQREDAHWVEDLNSSNGSYLNGRRLLEMTRIDDGDVLSIGKCTFTIEHVQIVKINQPAVVYTKRVLKELQDDRGGYTGLGEVPASTLFQRLTLLPTCKTLVQLCAQFQEVFQRCLPIDNIEFWTSSSQSISGIKRICSDRPGLFSFDDLDITKQQLIWNDQAALIFDSSIGDSLSEDERMIVVPIVSKGRTVGAFTATMKNATSDVLSILIVALYGFTKEWMVLEPWMNQHIARTPFVTTLQWMLAPMSSTNSLEVFQQHHQLRCTALQYLSKDISWSDRDRTAVECAMSMLQNKDDEAFFDQQRTWFDQSEDSFVRDLLSIVNGYTNPSVVQHKGIELMRLSMYLVEYCVEDPYVSSPEVMDRLSTVVDVQSMKLKKSDLDVLLPMLHRIQHQEQETQLFQR